MQAIANRENKKWNYDDILQMQEGIRCEILEGDLFMPPSPTWEHQDITGSLYIMMRQYAEDKNLGKVFLAPLDVILDENNVVQPDILFIKKENLSILQKRGRILGAPDLVVEIISPSSVYHDSYHKKDLYEKYKISEYWIVDPGNQIVEIFVLKDGKYTLLAFADEKGKVKSQMLEGLEIALTKIFRTL